MRANSTLSRSFGRGGGEAVRSSTVLARTRFNCWPPATSNCSGPISESLDTLVFTASAPSLSVPRSGSPSFFSLASAAVRLAPRAASSGTSSRPSFSPVAAVLMPTFAFGLSLVIFGIDMPSFRIEAIPRAPSTEEVAFPRVWPPPASCAAGASISISSLDRMSAACRAASLTSCATFLRSRACETHRLSEAEAAPASSTFLIAISTISSIVTAFDAAVAARSVAAPICARVA